MAAAPVQFVNIVEVVNANEKTAASDGPPPKPPMPARRANNFFIMDHYANANKELGPNHRPADVFRLLSEKWLAFTPRQREPYERDAQADLARYKHQKALYESAYAVWSKTTDPPPLRVKKRKSDTPRRPKTAYRFFAEAIWKRCWKLVPEMSDQKKRAKETWRLVRLTWKKLNERQLAKYMKMHAVEKQRYRQEMAAVLVQRKLKRDAIMRELGLLPPEEHDDCVIA